MPRLDLTHLVFERGDPLVGRRDPSTPRGGRARSIELLDLRRSKDRPPVRRRRAVQWLEQKAAPVLGDLRIALPPMPCRQRYDESPATRAAVMGLEHRLAPPLGKVHCCRFVARGA